MVNRRHIIAGLGALAPLSLRPAGVRAQAARTPVIVTTTTPIDVLPFFYGMQQKWFERAGLDVTFTTLASGALALVAVTGGAANIGFGNPLSILIAYSKGAPVQLVAPGSDFVPNAPTAQIFVLPDSPIRAARDLEDKSFAVTGLHDLMALAVRTWADGQGADSSKIRFVEMPPSSMLTALQTKRVDAVGLFEPFRTEGAAAGARALGAPYESISREFITGSWFGNSSWIAQNRNAALRFAEVIRQAGEYANAHFEELVPLMSSFSRMSAEVIARSNRPHHARAVTVAAIQPLIDVAAKYKEIPNAFRAQEFILTR
jgi:NitT/TauT family transport system substrate-binding protein